MNMGTPAYEARLCVRQCLSNISAIDGSQFSWAHSLPFPQNAGRHQALSVDPTAVFAFSRGAAALSTLPMWTLLKKGFFLPVDHSEIGRRVEGFNYYTMNSKHMKTYPESPPLKSCIHQSSPHSPYSPLTNFYSVLPFQSIAYVRIHIRI